MFQTALIKLWEEFLECRPEIEQPQQVLNYIELVIDPNNPNRLIEHKRMPGTYLIVSI